jgi:ABC-type multidrug transport system fused ATPase/permease subunit
MLIVPRDIRDRPGATDILVTRGEVAFDGVTFAYDHRKPIFERLALTIPAGQRVGLIGHSGAGKTTLVTLLMRLYDVQQGAVRIDGQNIAEVTQASLRRSIGLIPQDVVLFHRTLMENIRYGRPGASDAEVRRAAERAHAHEFIVALPEGYQTLVGERGVKLSGGQRQRIAIARAVLRDAPILLLDEATSALDAESETLVQKALDKIMQGRTTLVIAHRLATVIGADRILVLDHGRLVEEGTHQSLIARGGIYKRLADLQFAPDAAE